MRIFLVVVLLLSLILSGCGKNDEIVKLKKDTPAYQLAKDLASKVPYLDPEKNSPLITTKNFSVTTGEVIQVIYNNSGNRANQLKDMDANRIKMIIQQNSDRLADQKMVLREAKKAKFTVPQTELDSLMNVQYQYSGGEQKFLEMLQKSEVDIEVVKKGIRDIAIFTKYLDKTLGDQIQPTEEDIQKAYADYTSKEIASVQHILMLTQGKNDVDKTKIRKQMEDILARAKKGDDFAELAKQYSEDPGSKDRGGLYENFARGEMVKPFEDAAFSVPIGGISDIVETQYGFHILNVIDRNNFNSLEDHKSELEEQLKNKKKPDAYQTYMTKLKEAVEYKKIDF